MAPALVLSSFGAAAGVPLAVILAADIALLQSLAPLLVAAAGERESPSVVLRRIGRRIILDPIVIAVVAGIAYAATGLGLPAGVSDLVGLLGGIAPALGLLLVGLSLSARRTVDIPQELLPALAVKLFAHPVIVYLLLGWVGDFNEAWVFTAVMIAALPPALQAVPLAARAFATRAAAAADLGLIVSFVTLVTLGALLIAGVLPADPFGG
jgi:predicted permease